MLGYSPISAIDRIIEPSPQYDQYFDKPKTGELKRKVLSNDAGVEETVSLMINVINKHYKEVDRAKHLVRGTTTFDTAKKIFDFIYNHIKYNLEPGEILHTPAAVYWHGQVMARQNPGKTADYPIDCDDMAIMACSFLKSLHMPWALRIASYDGVKFGHVYCVVPGKKEIIIDPVYIKFNSEKPYKMQKTFIGSTEGMAGIPVYLQSVNGLSGLTGGSNPESIRLINGLLAGSHFSGLGNVNEDLAMLGYLKDTLALSKKHPEILINNTYKKPYMFTKMLERAIAGLNTDEESEILDILAEQEKQFTSQSKAMSGFAADNDWYYDENPEDQELSGLNYRKISGERYFNVGNLGFFGRLGLLRKLKNKIAAKRIAKAQAKGNTAKVEKLQNRIEKRANKANRNSRMLNKANPVIAPVIAHQTQTIPEAPRVQTSPMIPVQKIQESGQNYPVQMDEENYTEAQNSDSYSEDPIFEPEINYTDENTDETDTDEIIEGLSGGIHFSGFGLGSFDQDNRAILGYLKDTLRVSRQRPGMVRHMYKKPYMFSNMLENAIKGLEADEESDILDILAEQEKQNLVRPLSGLDSDMYDIEGLGVIDFGGLGLFGRLGLFKKLKQKRIVKLEKKGKTAKADKLKAKIVKQDKRKVKRKKAIKNIVRAFNKVNPVTIAARNGLRVLIALNFVGIASKLKANGGASAKVRELFVKMGGDVNKINQAIENGAKKKPLAKNTGSVKSTDGVEGLGQFGAVVAMSSLIAVAGKIINKITEWIKEKKAAKAERNAMDTPERQGEETFDPGEMPAELSQESNLDQNTVKPTFFQKATSFVKQNFIQKPTQQQKQDQELTIPIDSVNNTVVDQTIKPMTTTISKSNIGLWAAGIVGTAALAYFATHRAKNQTLSGHKKLSGIKLK